MDKNIALVLVHPNLAGLFSSPISGLSMLNATLAVGAIKNGNYGHVYFAFNDDFDALGKAIATEYIHGEFLRWLSLELREKFHFSASDEPFEKSFSRWVIELPNKEIFLHVRGTPGMWHASQGIVCRIEDAMEEIRKEEQESPKHSFKESVQKRGYLFPTMLVA